jgi:two-component system, response regulator, stage 0 sporulation protein A
VSKLHSVKIGIADDNLEFCQLLEDYFSAQKEIKVVVVVHNGLETIKMLQEEAMDVLLLDIIMPQLDGLGVLQWLKDNPNCQRPKIIVLSAFSQEEIARNAVDLGVDYYILKPFDLRILTQRIVEIAKEPVRSVISHRNPIDFDLEMEVTRIIMSLKIPQHFKGFAYLRQAILMTIQNPDLINEITKKLYPLIADHYDTTQHRVERSMRFAIETVWNKGDVKVLQILHELFGYCVDDKKGKPTNASFIAIISDKIRLEKKNRAV